MPPRPLIETISSAFSATKKLLLIGLAIRFFLMPISFHYDLLQINWYSNIVYLGHPDIYAYLSETYGPTFWLLPSYPSIIYYLGAVWQSILITCLSVNTGYFHLPADPSALPALPLTLFLLKCPYLLFDFGIAYSLRRLVSHENRDFVFALWVLNPLTIFDTYMMGRFDIVPIFFTVLALLFAHEANMRFNGFLSLVMLGIAASFQPYALIFIPVFAIFLGRKDWARTLGLVFVGVAPWIVSVIPFLQSPGFVSAALVGGKSVYLTQLRLDMPGGLTLYPILAGLVAVVLCLILVEEDVSFDALAPYCVLTLTVLYATTFIHIPWYAWITPFLAIIVAKWRILFVGWIGLVAFFCVHLLWWQNPLGAGIFSPLLPSLARFEGLSIVIGQDLPFGLLDNAAYTLILTTLAAVACAGLYYLHVHRESMSLPRWRDLRPVLPILMLTLYFSATIVVGSSYVIGATQDSATGPVGEIVGPVTVGQTFKSQRDDLSGIGVPFGTYMRNNDHPVEFHLREYGSDIDLVMLQISPQRIRDNALMILMFSPIHDSAQKVFFFFFTSPSSSSGDAFTLWMSSADVYPDGQMIIDDRPSAGDLVFRSYHTLNFKGLVSEASIQIDDNRVFFFVYTLVLFALVVECFGASRILKSWLRGNG